MATPINEEVRALQIQQQYGYDVGLSNMLAQNEISPIQDQALRGAQNLMKFGNPEQIAAKYGSYQGLLASLVPGDQVQATPADTFGNQNPDNPNNNISRFERGFNNSQGAGTTNADISSPGANSSVSQGYTRDAQGNVYDSQGNHVTLDQLPKGADGKPTMNLTTLPLKGSTGTTGSGVSEVTATEGQNAVSQYTPPAQTPPSPAVTNFLTQDPNIMGVINYFNQAMSQESQQKSLAQTFSDMEQQQGIPALDTEMLNIQNLMNGQDQAVRDEVTKAGGFATEQQVQATVDARNKLLLNRMSILQMTKQNAENYVNSYMGFTEQDRTQANNMISQGLNFGLQIADYAQKAQANATSKAQWLVGQIGLNGLKNATNGDPYYQGLIENTLGLPPGALNANLGVSQTEASAVLSLATKYPDAGINLTDSLANASSKLQNSKLYAKSTASTKITRIGTDALGNAIYGMYDPATNTLTPVGFSGGSGTPNSNTRTSASSALPSGFKSSGNSVIDQNVIGIMNGSLPPPVSTSGIGGSSKQMLAIKAGLEKNGVNLSQLALDWSATQKYIQTANSSQQVRLKQAIGSVQQGIGQLRTDANAWNAGGFAPLNAVNMKAALNGVYGQNAQQIAADFQQQATIIQDELGQTFMGGNSPTDKALGLAGQVFNTSWSNTTLNSSLDQLDQNLNFRLNAINNVQVGGLGGSDNPYSPNSSTDNSSSGGDYNSYLNSIK